MIDERLRGGPYSTTARIFAAPEAIAVGDSTSPSDIADRTAPRRLQREPQQSPSAPTRFRPDSIDIFPGAESYFDQEPATIKFARRQNHPHRFPARQHRPAAVRAGAAAHHQPLRPQSRKTARGPLRRHSARPAQRHPLRRRQALLPALRLRSHRHRPLRLGRSAERGRNAQGASTLSMQLARDMFLDARAQLAAQSWPKS